ncbi:hypothetical protein BJV82DRAFT_629915, partial [Fennellomyces sp. T-0311]
HKGLACSFLLFRICASCRCFGCFETASLQSLHDFGGVLSPRSTLCQVPGCVLKPLYRKMHGVDLKIAARSKAKR